MAATTLTPGQIRAGIWEGVLCTPAPAPQIEVWHQDRLLPAPMLIPLEDRPGCHALHFSIPGHVLADGVQTLLFRDAASGQILAHCSLIAGAAPQDDLRAEVDLLRAELELLKRAFRHHCAESAGR